MSGSAGGRECRDPEPHEGAELEDLERDIGQVSVAARALATREDLVRPAGEHRPHCDDLQGERRFSSSTAYGNAKLANILFTKELARRFGGQGLNAVAFHPGAIASSFAGSARGAWHWLYTNPLAKRLLTSTDVGGSRLGWLAIGTPGVDWRSGGYYANNRPARTSPLAADPLLAARLWRASAAMVGVDAD